MPNNFQALENLTFLPENLLKKLIEAAKLIQSNNGSTRVISHHDADGICAAGIISSALKRKNLQFHTSMIMGLGTPEIETLVKEGNDLIIFMDMGSGQVDIINELDCKIIILDHHTTHLEMEIPPSILEININKLGMNGTSEACASTLAFLTAVALDELNWDLIDLAMAGMLGDKQHLEGLKGINRDLADHAKGYDLVQSYKSLAISGKTLLEGIEESSNPFIRGLTGEPEAIKSLLNSLRIDPEITPLDMDANTIQKLGSILTTRLLQQGVRPEIAEEFLAQRYKSSRRNIDIEDLSHIINSCGRMSRQSIGLAVCMGDRSALELAREIRREYKTDIRAGMIELSNTTIDAKSAIQFLYTDKPSIASTFAGLGMQFLFDSEKPLLVLTKLETETKVSGRGTHYLVRKGLDLSSALHQAATKLGGVGGGHPVASGATIPNGSEQKFLELVNDIVAGQIGKPNQST